MTSPALDAWRSSRLPRLDRLLAAHPESAGSSTDPAVAREWTEALVLRLAAEFQGFCRDLHDDVVDTIVRSVTPPGDLQAVLADALILGRGLDRRSADPSTIAADFARFGSDLWAGLESGRRGMTPAWREGLLWLHRACNGVAHADDRAVASAEAAGWGAELGSLVRWRGLLDEIATAMETQLNQVIADLMRKNR